MTESRTFLENLHRRIIALVAQWTGIAALVSFLVSLGFFISDPGYIALLTMGITALVAIGCGLTLLLRNQPIWQMVLPFAASIIISEISAAVGLAEISSIGVLFLIVVVTLVTLSNQRALTLATMLICTALAVTIIIFAPISTTERISPFFHKYFHASNIAVLIVTVWAIVDRIRAAQLSALQIAEERAQEAEQARQASEMARQEAEQRAAEQQRLLELVQTLELPVLAVDDKVLLAPLVGSLDSWRANALRKQILETVVEQRAQVVIIDVTGIPMMDTEVAKALIDTAAAIRLLGAHTIVSGIRATVAQTLVSLNTSLGDITTTANLGAALALARREVEAQHPTNGVIHR